jgi:hypothetical protein
LLQDFPQPEDHWINQPVEGETPQLLLQLSVGQPAIEFTQLLVRAGARADMYSDDVGQERHLAHFLIMFFAYMIFFHRWHEIRDFY